MLDRVRCWIDGILEGYVGARIRNTAAFVVAGIIESQSVVTAKIGRALPGEALDKHKIKRVDRLIGNDRFDATAISHALLDAFKFRPGQEIFLALDWTKIGSYQVMTTSVATGGRAIPFQWTVIDDNKKRMARAEREHIQKLKMMLPQGVDFTLLFDAGYDSSSYLELLNELNLPYIVRVSSQVCVKPEGDVVANADEGGWFHLGKQSWKRSTVYDWGWVSFSKEHGVRVRFVAIHDDRQKDPWLLVTTRNCAPRKIIHAYGRRFETEETYKDYKDVRNGLQLKGKRIKTPERLARLIALETLAYWLTSLTGLQGEEMGLHRQFQANTIRDRRVIALWRVGREILRRSLIRGHHLLERLHSLLDSLSRAIEGDLCRSSG